MAEVCKWLGFYLCLKESPKQNDNIHPDSSAFEAVIVWKENPKQKAGGMAYEVILAPASAEATVPQLAGSPPKERPISGEFIQQKLKDAEERRQSAEVAKLAAVAKDKERAQEAIKRVEELNDSFSKTVEKRLSAKFDAAEERKDQQFKELQDRLKEHEKRSEQVRQNKLNKSLSEEKADEQSS